MIFNNEIDPSHVKALYDSGASVSLLNLKSFRAAQKAGKVHGKVKDVHLSLRTASGSTMRVIGVYLVEVNMVGQTIVAPFVVTPDVKEQAIIGMNIIRAYGLSYDAVKGEPYFKTKESISQISHDLRARVHKPSWETAQLRVAKSIVIQPEEAALTKCRVTDHSGVPLKGRVSVIADIAGISHAMETDEDGFCQVYIPNPSSEPAEFQKGCEVSELYPMDDYQIMDRFTEERWNATIGAVKEDSTVKRKPVPDEDMNEAIAQDAPAKTKRTIKNLLIEYEDIISRDRHDLGYSETVVHDIELRDNEPVYTQQFRLPLDQLQLLKEHVHAWLRCGVVRPTKSKYNSAMFCVPKKEGHGLRVVLDYRRLNAKTLPDRYSIRTVEQCIEELGAAGSKVFSCLDLRSGFWQMKLDEKSRKYSAFTLPGVGQFEWVTTPMGLTGSPASFARLMDKIMEDAKNVITYIDDCLVHSKDYNDHPGALRQAFSRLRKHGLKINLVKCKLAASEVQYLGHSITRSGVKPGIDKTKAIMDTKPPTNQKQVKSFVGLCNYFRGYIKDFAQIAAPLYKLTRQDCEWEGGRLPPKALTAFQTLRGHIASEPILAYPNRTGTLHLYTDGAQGDAENEGGLGAVLMQDDVNGVKRTIGFASRRLQKHEKNYPAFLLEMQAAIFGMEYFETYLRGRQFSLYTDHKPLCKLSTVHTKTLNRLQLKMNDLHPEIRYVKGEDNTVADFLSRYQGMNVGMNAAAVDASPFRIQTLQDLDPEVTAWKKETAGLMKKEEDVVKLKDGKFMTIRDGILMIRVKARTGFLSDPTLRTVIPKPMRPEFVQTAHNSVLCGHAGLFKTTERIRSTFWWPNLEKDVASHIKACKPCQATSSSTGPTAPLQQLPIPAGPNERVHADLFGPLKSSSGKQKFVLVITDALTKHVSLTAIEHKDADTVAKGILDNWVYMFGVPKKIVTDQGNEFCNDLQKALWRALQLEHKVTTPYHPQTNAQAEVFNKTMAHYLKVVLLEANKSSLDWELYLAPLAFSHNTAVHKSTKVTPFYATFGYDPRVPLWDAGDVLQGFEETEISDTMADALYKIHEAQNTARRVIQNNTQHAKEEQLRSFNKANDTQLPSFKAGDLVWVRIKQSNDPNKKLAKTQEEGTIIERLSFTTYRVRRDQRTRKKYATLNVHMLKPRVGLDNLANGPSSGPAANKEPDQAPPADSSPLPSIPGPLTRARAKQQLAVMAITDDVECVLRNPTPEGLIRLLNLGFTLTTLSGPPADPPAPAADQPVTLAPAPPPAPAEPEESDQPDSADSSSDEEVWLPPMPDIDEEEELVFATPEARGPPTPPPQRAPPPPQPLRLMDKVPLALRRTADYLQSSWRDVPSRVLTSSSSSDSPSPPSSSRFPPPTPMRPTVVKGKRASSRLKKKAQLSLKMAGRGGKRL